MSKITYEDKEAWQIDPTIPDKKQVKSTDMNEIKYSVNTLYDDNTDINRNVNNLKSKIFNINFDSTGVKSIDLNSGRGSAIISVAWNGGAFYGIYVVWFNNFTLLESKLISGKSGALTISIENKKLNLTANAYSTAIVVMN